MYSNQLLIGSFMSSEEKDTTAKNPSRTKRQKTATGKASLTTQEETLPAHRPSKYKTSYCARLVAHMSQGKSFESFAGEIGVAVSTIYKWLDIPDFSEAKDLATAKSLNTWEDIGLELAKKGNGQVWALNMKNRFGWKDRVETEERAIVVNVTPDNKDQLKKLAASTDDDSTDQGTT